MAILLISVFALAKGGKRAVKGSTRTRFKCILFEILLLKPLTTKHGDRKLAWIFSVYWLKFSREDVGNNEG